MPDIELALRDLADAIAFPETPDLTPPLGEHVSGRVPPVWRRRLVLVAMIVAVAVVAGLAVPQARTAVLRFFGIGAVRIEYVERLPTVTPGAPFDLGTKISAEDTAFPIVHSELLGEPDAVYETGNVVTLLYGSPDAVRVLVTEIAGPPVPPEVMRKIVGSTTSTELVPIAGSFEPGIWIEGEPHVLVLPGAPARLAANTLVWRRGDLTLRIEGAASRDEAVRIAESFR